MISVSNPPLFYANHADSINFVPHAFIRIGGPRFKRFYMAKAVLVCCVMFFIMSILNASPACAQKRTHSVFFENTDYELHVYRIYGESPGKTLLLIGGIQGDEPGGFLSADHYAELGLLKGNLIVVPRANFQSILLNKRQINEDMNRKFSEDRETNYETKIVAILKKLIAESDMLLNLHDGSGFYTPDWQDDMHNPGRFGQSIIADTDFFINPKTGESVDLSSMAELVVQKINKNIDNPTYYFHFNNHKTKSQESIHKEQRKSATYYALYTCGIPAFGVESSKSLPLESKVRHHNLAINAFMDLLDIIPEHPVLNLEPPVLKYLILSINNSFPIALTDNQTLYIKPGDTISISHIESNYERGLTADITGYGGLNDIRTKTVIDKNTSIVVKKDYYPCGKIFIEMAQDKNQVASTVAVREMPSEKFPLLFFLIKINGEKNYIPSGETIYLIKGDTFEIVDIIGSKRSKDYVVNFKGFVGNPDNNTGEDRGYVIDTAVDLWERYSILKKGKVYQVLVKDKDETVGKLLVKLKEPVLEYVALEHDNGEKNCYFSGETAVINPDKPLKILDVKTNVPENGMITASISNPGTIKKNIEINKPFRIFDVFDKKKHRPPFFKVDFERSGILIGSVLIKEK